MFTIRNWQHELSKMAFHYGLDVEADELDNGRCYLVRHGHPAFRVAVVLAKERASIAQSRDLRLWAAEVVARAEEELRWLTVKPDPASEEWDNRRWVDRMI